MPPHDDSNSGSDDVIAQSWLPEPLTSLNSLYSGHGFWAHESFLDENRVEEMPSQSMLVLDTKDAMSDPFWQALPTSGAETMIYQPQISHGSTDIALHTRPKPKVEYPILNESDYFQVYSKPFDRYYNSADDGSSTVGPPTFVSSEPGSALSPSSTSPFGFALDWSTSSTCSRQSSIPVVDIPKPEPATMTKRKRSIDEPPTKKARQVSPDRNLADFVVIFENAPGALSSIKHRRRLDAPVRQAARAVRKAGACHQCRFRKRTCSTGTPCTSCLKNGNGLHELKCQRESPFLGRTIHEYFEFSSKRRIVCFDILLPCQKSSDFDGEFVEIDGIGGVSLPIKLRARRKALSAFSADERNIINRTRDSSPKASEETSSETPILILEKNDKRGCELEQWAVEYASKFVHAAGPEFTATTMAVILGTAYVKKNLPESALVATMLRVASISFVLRAGIKHTNPTSPSPPHRTIPASIDTILYQRLQLAEKSLFSKLQRLVFRSAGYMSRSQIYPVALVLWQLLRISCIASSHLSNIIAQRFRCDADIRAQADHQYLVMKLVLSTHLALFRSSCPLVLDWKDTANWDLLGNDWEMVGLAEKMAKVVCAFREKGVSEMKGSIAYRREYFEMFRKIYVGL